VLLSFPTDPNDLLLSGLLVVPSALLAREMRFGALARSQVVGSLFGAVAAISMALAGFGVWALVAQPLCGASVTLAGCALAQHWYPRFEFSWLKVKSLARFSAALLGTSLVNYLNRNTDSVLVGRVLGAGPLGQYSMGVQLMLYPLQHVSSVFVRVLLPTLMQLQDDLQRLRTAYLKTAACIALVTFPIMGGLFALADDFVQVVFGPNWNEMAPLLKVLAWVGMLQSVGTTVGTLYLSTGNPGTALRVTLIGTPVLVGGMVAGLPWGILGVAVGYAVANFSFFYYSVTTAFRLVHLPLADFHRVMIRPLGATLAMIGVLEIAVPSLPTMAPTYRLPLCVSLGVVIYAAVSFAINRAQIAEVLSIARSLRARA
jgi:PST family polysaccharide transporter